MSQRDKKYKRQKVIYWEEIPVIELSLDSPIGDQDEDLVLMDTLGFDEEYDSSIDATITRQHIIFSLPEIEEVEILILKQMGYKYWEIKKILRLRSLSQYYQIFNRLRENYSKALKKLRDKGDIM